MLLHCLGNDRMAHMMPSGAEQECDGEDSDEEVEEGGNESEDGEEEGGDGDGDDGEKGMIGPFDDDWMDAVVQVMLCSAANDTESSRVPRCCISKIGHYRSWPFF